MWMDKEFLRRMSELDEAAHGAYVVPVTEEERDAVDQETKRTIELMKKGQFNSTDPDPLRN